MPTYLLAHDLGTTGNKATLFNSEGDLIASTFAPYPLHYPQSGWAEQEAEDWWHAVCLASRQLMAQIPDAKQNLMGVGFSAMMNGCLLLDASGNPLHSALIHADIRSTAQAAQITERIGEERSYQITGNRISSPYFTISKLAWLAEQRPDLLSKARGCVQTKDFIVGKMTGNFGVTDYSDASLTGCFDLERKEWSAEIQAAAGVSGSLFSEVLPSHTQIGTLTRLAAEETGLPTGLPVFLGGGDGACATAGASAVCAGDAYHYLGGTSWVAALTGSYRPDPTRRVSVFCALQPEHYVVYGTVQSAGSSVDWLQRVLEIERFEELEALALEVPAGSRGVLFLPYLAGERSPIWDASARGVFFGLSAAHGRGEMVRAVFEGVSYALASNLAVLESLGLAPQKVRVLGGGMRSPLWRAILSAVYGRPLIQMERLAEATSCGAAMAVSVGLGIVKNYTEAAQRFAPQGKEEMPDLNLMATYRRGAELFLALYPTLAERFAELASLQEEAL
jgi:xylulokinase